MAAESLAVVVFLFTLIVALVSWIIQIYVSRRLKKAGMDTGPNVGKSSWIQPLILGWQNAEELGILFLMTLWSVLLALTIIGGGATVILFINTAQP